MQSCHLDNMDRPKGYYAMWSKLDRERQILYVFIYTWNLKYKTKTKYNKTERDSKI